MIIAEVSYLRDDDFLFSRNTMYKKSFFVIDGYYPPVCYLYHRNPPLISFLDRKNHSDSDKITIGFVRVRQGYFLYYLLLIILEEFSFSLKQPVDQVTLD